MAHQQGTEPGTVVFDWVVKPGQDETFEHEMHELHRVARTFPGHMGVTTLKSQAQPGSFQTVLRFDSTEHLDAWLGSPARHEIVARMESVASVQAMPKMTGLETWFEVPGRTTRPPPRWKMVVTTFVAIYPLSLLYGYLVAPHVTGWPIAARSLFLPVFAPVILTYLFMPVLTQRLLRSWLYPAPRGPTTGRPSAAPT